MIRGTFAGVVSGGLLVSGGFAQSVVYEHELVVDDAKVGLGWYSSSEPRPNKNFLRVDDFTLTAGHDIGSVVWWGQSTSIFEDSITNFSSFTVAFYESRVTTGGELRPRRNPFASQVFGVGEFGADATGRIAMHGGIEHRFTAELDSAVSLASGVTYFFSVAAGYVDPARDAFEWSDAEEVNGYGGSWSYAEEQWLMQQDTDSAFQLLTVPAPGGAGFIGVGMLLCARRRR